VGEGVVGTDPEGRRVGVGSPRLLRRLGVVTTDHVAVAREGGGLLATFEIGESVRPEASEAVAELRDDGIGSVILTGDTRDRAEQVAEALGVPVHAELSAAEKVTRLRDLGRRAAMVGDGLNDAPALAGAGPSFAVEGSTGLARGMARVTLLDSDLRLVPWTLGMARHAMRNVRWLLGVSTAYNLVFVSLAAAGALRPVFAGLSMLVSSLVTLAFAATAGEHKR
jgi:P-type E1-E2 ATPase